MRRLSRIPQFLDPLLEPTILPRNITSTCHACRRRSALLQPRSFSTTASRHADSKAPLTERLRRRMWGTEQPPGQEDPYSRDSPMRTIPPRQEEQRQPEVAAASTPQVANAYEQATTWDELEWVGSKEYVEELEASKKPVRVWLPETKVTAPEEVTAALRRAVIEVFTLVQARGNFRALWQRENPEDPTFEDWTADVKLDASEDNDAVLAFPSTEVKEQALRVLGIPDEQARDTARRDGAGPGAALSREEMTEARGEATLSYHRRWRHISLQNPDVKFAIIKRVMQLTGIRLHDPVIQKCNTVGILFEQLVAKPKPKKLAEALETSQRFAELPNVKVFGRRVTPIDKERQVGRWKVIEQELLDRGLPVTGHA